MQDCRKCKGWTHCKGYLAYEPKDIQFCYHQMKWLIKNIPILHQLIWPEGYGDITKRKRPSGKGYFETPIDYAVEVERRLENCGLDGLMLYLYYALEWEERDIAKYYRLSFEAVKFRMEAVLWHISGWNYRAGYYRRWNVYRAFQNWKDENASAST